MPAEWARNPSEGALEMVKTGCTTAYDLFMSLPYPSLEEMEAVVRAYTDVGLRVVLAPAVADLRFWDTVPGLLGALPPEVAQRIEGMRPPSTDALLRLDHDGVVPGAQELGGGHEARHPGADHHDTLGLGGAGLESTVEHRQVLVNCLRHHHTGRLTNDVRAATGRASGCGDGYPVATVSEQ